MHLVNAALRESAAFVHGADVMPRILADDSCGASSEKEARNCLAQTPATGAEYLVHAPSGGTFSVNPSATTRVLNTEWLNPSTGCHHLRRHRDRRRIALIYCPVQRGRGSVSR